VAENRQELTMDNDDVVDVLNDLLETCRDGEYGFRTCAQQAESPELKAAFEVRAGDCERAGVELKAAIVALSGNPAEGGTASGALHRGWVTLRASVSAVDDVSILEECERGEDSALGRYREAIQQSLPESIAAIVRRQYEGTKKNHDEVRAMRDRFKAQQR
jgi:uncharacterized protein (TIGR02284 family)